MASLQGELNWFTPLPPARNGIADYAGMLLREIALLTPCQCYCEDPLAEIPSGVELRDPLQAFRHLSDRSPVLHHLGNNSGHIFVLEALRNFGGITSLHDLSLFYLNELSTHKKEYLYGRMQSPAQTLGATYARHWKDVGLKTAANYVLFDMVGEVLALSCHIIVHSEYARKKLTAIHGEAVKEKITVIPHFAKTIGTSSLDARNRLGIDPADLILLTSGFATEAKRFDWLLEALDYLRQRGIRFRWIHAGEERPAEYRLTEAIRTKSGLIDRCSITGYLTDETLDCYLAAADIVVNLRFPSIGESSGTLARALSAGRCCVVSDTAAYAELPRDAVVHIPIFDAVGALCRALESLFRDNRLRQAFGRRAQQFARTFLSIDSIAKLYVETIAASYQDGPIRVETQNGKSRQSEFKASLQPTNFNIEVHDELPDLSTCLRPGVNDFNLVLWFSSAEHFSTIASKHAALIHSIIGPHVEVNSIDTIGPTGIDNINDSRIGIRVAGRACG